eukprot:CAMPEP_0176436752 /NCGR_PEP_ID=MMETSP0127-20121128/18171_1 /TAXON_ID=938130 /ORGANISM="Platyophrya macrostoma, Strain WH" /LENGTH=171 /DNA_ID=CAMNT_0017820163 /DNA_START=36 /DNA_END=551 /DNA_ORIENTATION=-
MSFKFCYNGEIHRCSKTITTFKDLKESFQLAYKGKLPISFSLQYFDEDNDAVLLSDEKDFKAMMSANKDGKPIKIHIKGEDDEYEIIDQSSIPEEYKERTKSKEEKIYNKEVEEKAKRLKELLPDNDIDVYLHYVSLDPEKTVEELVDDYLSKYAKTGTTAVSKPKTTKKK